MNSMYTYGNQSRDHASDGGLCRQVDRSALVSLRFPMKEPTVVSIDRWSLYTSGL